VLVLLAAVRLGAELLAHVGALEDLAASLRGERDTLLPEGVDRG
jgi:hypothetical protein